MEMARQSSWEIGPPSPGVKLGGRDGKHPRKKWMGEMEDQELSTAPPFHLAPTRKPLLASGEPLSSKCKEWDSSHCPALYTSIPPKQFQTNRRAQKMPLSEKAREWDPRELGVPGWLTPKRKRPSGFWERGGTQRKSI